MKLTGKIITFLSIITLIILIPASLLIWNHQRNTLMEQAKIQAETLFEMIVITRQWVSENDRRIDPVPAVATKELSQYASRMADFRFHITSDKLVNPENAPDKFEKKAMKAFKEGRAEEYAKIIENDKGEKIYRYMAPLYINESCLKCHYYQGYDVGEFRGGISVYVPMKNIEAAMQSTNILFYISGFIIYTGIMFAVIVLLNNLILKHLKKLNVAAHSVFNKNYDIKTDIKTNDEIQELSDAFELMCKRVAKSEENLKSRLKDAVSGYVKLNEELRKKNQELRKTTKFKTDVLDSVAHEVRTPMTKIMSYTDILLDPNMKNDDEVLEKAIKVIKRNSKTLNMLFNQVITITKLEHFSYEYEHEEIYFHDLIRDKIEFFEEEINLKNLKVNINVPENLYFYADSQALSYVVNNLISNSIKYNKESGLIEISAEEKDEKIILSFYDTGIGIPSGEIQKITQRFYRVENIKKKYTGSGLGLSIVKRIIDDLNGKLEIKSKEGSFTLVTITLQSGK